MKNTIRLFAILLLVSTLASCGKSSSSKTEQKTEPTPVPEIVKPLYEYTEAKGFKMGGCASPEKLQLLSYKNMIKNEFNSLTATNEMKLYSLLDWSIRSKDGMPAFNFYKCDQILSFAQENNIKVRGHVLVWDAYMTEWYFYKDYNTKDFADAETMKARMKYSIETVIEHCESNFPGVVYCWDVVNEAVADSAAESDPNDAARIRTSRGGNENLYYKTMGRDYVKWAFKYAHDYVSQKGYDITLFYNDYNNFYSEKRNCIINLVTEINAKDSINPEGLKLCDGIGMQSYVGGYGTQNGCMNDSDINAIKETIEKYASLGYEVQITEMAVRNYNNGDYYKAQHAEYYGKLAKMLSDINETADGKFTCWAVWGLCDNPSMPETDYSYKMNGPYCGIFDWACKKKPEYQKIVDALSL